jgi:putative transposase
VPSFDLAGLLSVASEIDSMNKDLVSGSHTLGQSLYHLEWCPKYRYNALRSEHVKTFLKNTLIEIANKYGMKIHAIGIMPDHIHIFVEIPPTLSVSNSVQYFKGITARRIFQEFSGFRRRYAVGHFWSEGYFYRSVGSVKADVVQYYVEHQEEEIKQMKSEPKQASVLDFS